MKWQGYVVSFVIVVSFIVTLLYYLGLFNKTNQGLEVEGMRSNYMKYVPIGDSYTIGEGVLESDRWPNLLIGDLKENGISVEIVGNPAVSGFTVNDALLQEIPFVEKVKPDFVTVLIGANDNFMMTDTQTFSTSYVELVDKLQNILDNPKNIVLITIPDHTKTPASKLYKLDSKSENLIREYNNVIKDIANKRKLQVADIYPISQTMTKADNYVEDGLHPSAMGYKKWETVIFPIVLELLKK